MEKSGEYFIGLTNKMLSFFNRMSWYKKLFPFFYLVFLVVALDQLFKFIFKQNTFETSSFLGLSLEGPVKNNYFLFGFKIVDELFLIHLALISIFLLFSFYYIIFIFFVDNKKFYHLKVALSLIFAGWISNFIDKIMQFYVVDYIKWNLFDFIVFFNLADIVQSCGWILCIQQLIHFRYEIFRPKERRRSWLVLSKLQYQFLAYFTLVFILLVVFFLLLVKQVLSMFGLWDETVIKEIAFSFLMGLIFALVFLYIFIGLFFVYFSNKIYGPIYAFEKYIRELINGKSHSKAFRLRKEDQFKQLEILASDIKKHIDKSKTKDTVFNKE